MTAVMILVNCASLEEAERIAESLLNQELAAAVQIFGPGISRYKWDGQIHKKPEWLVMLKTSSRCEEPAKALIADLHSYQVPGILRVEIDGMDSRYLQWILQNTGVPS